MFPFNNKNNNQRSQASVGEDPRLRNIANGPLPWDGFGGTARIQPPPPVFRSPYEATPRRHQEQAPRDPRIRDSGFGANHQAPNQRNLQFYGDEFGSGIPYTQPGASQYQQPPRTLGSPYEAPPSSRPAQLQPTYDSFVPRGASQASGSASIGNVTGHNNSFIQQRNIQQNVAVLPQPQPGAVAPNQAGRQEGFLFDSLEHGLSLISAPDWNIPQNDDTIPNTDQKRCEWVLKLLTAMNNLDDVADSKNKGFPERWPVDGNSTHFSPIGKEIVCWDVLGLAEDMHRQGPGILVSFDWTFWQNAQAEKDHTFEQRLTLIVQLLHFSKARCEKLLNNDGLLQSVVAFPKNLFQATGRNMKVNASKKSAIDQGRPAKRQKL
jgi:hypothetical protein